MFIDCEFVGMGNKGSIKGTLTLAQPASHPTWASATALRLEDQSKFQVNFRLGLLSVADSRNLEFRYEYFAGSKRHVAETLAEVPPGVPVAFALTWDQSGRVSINTTGTSPRNLAFDFKPTRASFLISGATAQLRTETTEVIDCEGKADATPAK